jgi:hypothetical protein
MNENYLLIDFENVSDIDFSGIDRNTNILIFHGVNQTKANLDLVKQTQTFGDKLKWIKIEGSGKNNLDLHLTYFLGKRVSEHAKGKFFILSKDKDYDNLIKFIQKRKVNCKRIKSISEMIEKENIYEKCKNILINGETKMLPKNLKTLSSFLSQRTKGEAADISIEKVSEYLKNEKILSFDENGKITYQKTG